jgi:hypothetical protein
LSNQNATAGAAAFHDVNLQSETAGCEAGGLVHFDDENRIF